MVSGSRKANIKPGRKIRDRIAKLQERVIANELRAAAAINGWDQPYSPSPLLSPRHTARQPSSLQASSRDTSPTTTEPSTPFHPAYSITPPLWPSDFGFAQSSGWFAGETPYITDGRGIVNETMCYSTSEQGMSPGIQLPVGSCHEGGLMQDVLPSSNLIPNSSNAAVSLNQPLYYVATGEKLFSVPNTLYFKLTNISNEETALPQILQAMSTVSPQTNVIVLVPSDSTSAYLSTPPSSLLGSNGLEGISSSQSGIQSLTCQCQPQSTHLAANNAQVVPRWSSSGSFSSGCSSHKISSSSGTSFQGMR